MEKKTVDNYLVDAQKWIYEAAANIKSKMNEPLEIDTKSNSNDLVTELDKETERFFASKIREKYPNDFLYSEEGYGDKLSNFNGTVWVIDPIDGTMNFVHQKRNFAISVGIYQEGIGEIGFIYNVMDDVLYSAVRGKGAYRNNSKLPMLKDNVKVETSIIALNSLWACPNNKINEKKVQQMIKDTRGTRSYGSAALEFAFLAEGIVDGYLTMTLSPWDFAAGKIIYEEVGGITTQADGEPVDMLNANTIFASNRNIYDDILRNYVDLK